MFKQPEVLVESITKNRNQLFAILGLVAVFGAVFAGYSSYRDSQASKAASELFVAEEKLAELSQEPAPAEGKSAPARDAAWLAKLAPALTALEDVGSKYKSLPVGYEALMKLGDTYYEGGADEKAISTYDKAASAAPSRLHKLFALYAKAIAAERSKNHELAVETFNDALRLGEKTLKADVLLGIGRNAALKNDTAKAKEIYETVIKEFPNSAYAQTAEMKKKALQ